MSRRGRAVRHTMRKRHRATLTPVHRPSYRASGGSCSSRLEVMGGDLQSRFGETDSQATWLNSISRRGSLAGWRNVLSASVHSPSSSPVSSHRS